MLWTIAVTAFAHTALEYPPPRYPSDGFSANKACPCGVGESNRYCDVPTDRSDPDRNESRATTFQAGETITVQFYESVGHAGRYRIAFDADGADMDDFNAQILMDVPDPAGNTGNVDGTDLWEFTVTLPNISCDNCTLQLVQMMDGNTTDPVPDPVGRSSYYQCADLVLTGGAPPDTDDTDSNRPAPDTDDTDDTDSTPTPADSKCGCQVASPVGSGMLMLGLAALMRRRR